MLTSFRLFGTCSCGDLVLVRLTTLGLVVGWSHLDLIKVGPMNICCWLASTMMLLITSRFEICTSFLVCVLASCIFMCQHVLLWVGTLFVVCDWLEIKRPVVGYLGTCTSVLLYYAGCMLPIAWYVVLICCDYWLHMMFCVLTCCVDMLCWHVVLTCCFDMLCWHVELTCWVDRVCWQVVLTSCADKFTEILCFYWHWNVVLLLA